MKPTPIHPADQIAVERILAMEPVWNGLESAADTLGLPANVLLHAGPPFDSVNRICRPILNSACVAAVFEGLCDDFDQAESQIASGEIILKPAQDHQVVVPLAAVVSASMPLHRIQDRKNPGLSIYTPINGGSRPALRTGQRSNAVLQHIRWLNQLFADFLRKGAGDAIPLIPIAGAGLREGDDCHGRTVASTRQLVARIKSGYAGPYPRAAPDPDILEFMETSPSLFLNLWMAASKIMMMAASGIQDSSLVTAMGGNGVDVGIQIAGLPGRWFTLPAQPPQGKFDLDVPTSRALGAIGDSAVVEGFGLGAMVVRLSPEQARVFADYLPTGFEQRCLQLPIIEHSGFHESGVRLGLTARSVAEWGKGPIVGLGILDNMGELGRLGGGIYDMSASLFREALAELEK